MNDQQHEEEVEEMGFLDHIGELRLRLLMVFISVSCFSVFGWFFSRETFHVLSQPFFMAFPNDVLIGTGPAEAFILRLKVSVFLGTLVSVPVIFHQLWLFIAPGLLDHERRFAIPFLISTSTLFLVGVWFCYSVVLPFAFEFFKSQYDQIGTVTPTIRISEHLALLMKALIGFGLVFETPVLAFLLGRLGVINARMLMSAGRYAIITIFLISALLTPPDVLTQFLMAGPLMALYGVSIVIVAVTGKKDS